MGLVTKVDLLKVDRETELAEALLNQFNTYHSKDYRVDKEVEQIAFQQKLLEFNLIGVRTPRPDMQIFSPSGASKCARELYYKALSVNAESILYPYHKRWTRNSKAVHEAVQKDLLYMSKVLDNPAFKVKMMSNGLPAWEENLKTYKEFSHNGTEFAILGMMDGILIYKDGSEIGFELKTKSNTIGQVGNFKLKAPAPYHLDQCTAYSLLFGINEFIVFYESLAKDGWNKGAEAKSDIRNFYYEVTEEAKTDILDKFSNVTTAIESRKIPERELDKCLFCPYKSLCLKK